MIPWGMVNGGGSSAYAKVATETDIVSAAPNVSLPKSRTCSCSEEAIAYKHIFMVHSFFWLAKFLSSSSQVHSTNKHDPPSGNTLTEFLVCPLSKQPLRYCEESNSLISDAIGVSFPVKNGIPCLVPRDGKILEEDASKPDIDTNLS